LDLKNFKKEDFGQAKRVVVYKDHTVLINENKKNVSKRIEYLKKIKDSIEDEFDKKNIDKRIENLLSECVLIRVGGFSQKEIFFKKREYEKYFYKIRDLFESSAVIGSGKTFLNISKILEKTKFSSEEEIGKRIFIKALRSPIRELLKNSNFDEEVIIQEISDKGENFSFNIKTEKIEDFSESKILDAKKTLKIILIEALAIAKTVLDTEVLIGEK